MGEVLGGGSEGWGGEYLRVTPIRLLRSSMAAILATAQAGWGTPLCSSHSK